MLGTIIGGIAGSTYKARELLLKEKNGRIPDYGTRTRVLDQSISLFSRASYCSDDIHSLFAIGDAVLQGKNYQDSLKEWDSKPRGKACKNHYSEDLRTNIRNFESEKDRQAVVAKMVSPVGQKFETLSEAERQAKEVALAVNSSPEAIHSAEAVAAAIFLSRKGASKEQIYNYLSFRFHYYLIYDLETLQRTNVYIDRAKVVTSEAIYILMIANDFEDGIRKAISIGGDCEAITAIAGSVLEAFYGVPENLMNEVMVYLSEEEKEIINQFYGIQKNKEKEMKKCNPS